MGSRWLPQGNLALATPAGGSTSTVVPSGVIHVNVTPQATLTQAEETLMSFSLPANALNVNGRAVRITAWGSFAANANSKTVGVYFGATAVRALTTPGNNTDWLLTATVLRTGAATQAAFGATVWASSTAVIHYSPAETLSGAVAIAVKATTATAIGDLTCKGLLVEVLN